MDVGGTLYDVTFLDGTCTALFDGCDDASDFVFDEASALTAANALLDQVFIDGPLGSFDMDPELTAGCDNVVCGVLIPYAIFSTSGVRAVRALNTSTSDSAGLTTISQSSNTSNSSAFNWASFSEANTAAVPLPAAGWAMFAAIGALTVIRRRARS
ncbi:MAG: VPLPA-CTERM sorting domain-containing protein [Pseudomonadota bacterium]